MISELRLSNFRAFSDAKLELGKITLVFGPNNSGKSGILSAINVLAQTVRSADLEVPLLLSGDLEKLGTYSDVVFGHEPKANIGIGLTFDDLKIRRPRNRPMRKVNDQGPIELDLSFGFRRQRRQIILNHSTLCDTEHGKSRILMEAAYRPAMDAPAVIGIRKNGHFVTDRARRGAPNHFLVRPPRQGNLMDNYEAYIWSREISGILFDIEQSLENIEAIGPFRQPPQRTYTFTGESPRFVGLSGENALAILAADESRRGARKSGLIRQISKWMESAGVASKVDLSVESERQFVLRLKHPVSGESANFADTGFGCSQVLPVLVGGYNAPKSSMFIVQQPEIHLHPRAQSELGTFLLALHKNSVQALVETHSEHLILRLQRYVAEGKLPAADLKVYYVHPSATGKAIVPIRVGDDGEFINEWPEGFFPERLIEAREIAKSAGRKRR